MNTTVTQPSINDTYSMGRYKFKGNQKEWTKTINRGLSPPGMITLSLILNTHFSDKALEANLGIGVPFAGTPPPLGEIDHREPSSEDQ